MSRHLLLLRALSLIWLVTAIVYPWVIFDPLVERQDRLAGIEGLVSEERLPTFIHEGLIDRGYRPGMSAEQLWNLFGRNENSAHFDFVAGRIRLFSWEFWRVPASPLVRLAVAGVYAAAALAILSFWPSARHAVDEEDETVTRSTLGSRMPRRALIAGGCLLIALLLVLVAPTLDTFGYFGHWGMAWLDVLNGARVTVAPRALAPLGLLLLAVVELAGED